MLKPKSKESSWINEKIKKYVVENATKKLEKIEDIMVKRVIGNKNITFKRVNKNNHHKTSSHKYK
jgi:hypothetical protein